ncbi:uncharacterized membrane protein YcjF (UPF0283 family) [Microbacterium ginsengiterrae]|uniref:Uncharacterized membrane protein YcjF (UPF0283 family) n=1 Tax=Microbacterium ginsengiterrae TaxID=546115 RepID=A0A7W9CAI8_9MICO|nr:hypothetical protein [Microbacterium ginsengiterrae]MBB5741918.1 uncharacterized membrane protein YcjF (UPF0283 family) [Microbacterium ginsengiterrae]
MTNVPNRPENSRDTEEARTSADEARTDAVIQGLNARVHWPQLPDDALEESTSPPQSASFPQHPQARKPRSGWRTAGIGALGLLGGVLLGVIVQDLLAVIFIRTGTPVLGLVFAVLIPLFAVLGVVTAILIDNRTNRRRQGDRQ